MFSATTGRVASITGRDRSESTWSPCQSLYPPLAAVTFRSLSVTRSTASRPGKFARACRGTSVQVGRAGRTGSEGRGRSLSIRAGRACRRDVGPIRGSGAGRNEMAQYLILIYEDEAQYA